MALPGYLNKVRVYDLEIRLARTARLFLSLSVGNAQIAVPEHSQLLRC